MTGSKALKSRVEQVAEQVVLADLKDLPAMAALCKELRAIGEGLQAKEPDAARVAGQAGELVQGIILEEVKDRDGAWGWVSEAVGLLQHRICQDRSVSWPEAFGSGSAKNETAGNGTSEPAGQERSELVDDELFKAFVEQQLSVLPEIEARILEFERARDMDAIAGLRRLIHTMKGEAGVVGIGRLQQACHRIEDYLDQNQQPLSADILFQFKDWLAVAVDALAGGEPSPDPESLSALISAAVVPVVQEAVREDPVPLVEPAAAAAHPHDAGIAVSDEGLARDFVAEAREHFDSADEGLLTLENQPDNEDAVGAVFRAFHTIKGVSSFLGLAPIGDVAHQAETLLDDVRKKRRRFEGRVVDVTFAGLDMLKAMVGDLGKALSAAAPFHVRPDYHRVMAELKGVISGKADPVAAPATKPAAPAVRPVVPDAPKPVDAQAAPVLEEKASEKPAGSAADGAGDAASQQMVKISSDRLDFLIDTIGELVIAESIVAQDPDVRAIHSLQLERNLSLLGKITRMLQDMGMSMRMTPIEPTFRKMARLVRDLAKKAGKQVEFAMVGQETELDRGMVDKLGDPLVHMIRNSVDHGIEATPADRVAAGKPAAGRITLKAFHKGGSIHIEIQDDGRGLDRDAIVKKAMEKGLIQDPERIPDSDVYALIFHAGFSTAKQVTEISGRGVGMDVVRRNIEGLRGNILISTEKGMGTTFTLVLPLTTAIIDGMITRVGEQIYVIPTLSIVESFRPVPDMVVTVEGRGEMVRFRERLLPLFRPARIFGISGSAADPCTGIVVVVEEGGRQAALLVDELLGQQQTVIKSLGAAIGNVQGVSGASIMADGRPGLILDPGGLMRLAVE